ncbi:DUF222 domain-containing protein, partial [Nocardioides sp. G10]|nr:DUF222 domain-containing protein [Nocardioides baculatus]
MAEFCVAELGTVLGISTTSAKKLIGHALELRHRLPRLWSQVQAGCVPAWRARSVAETTIHSTRALTREAAAFVDAQIAAVAGRIGPAQLDRLVAETIKRYDLADPDPAADPEDGYLSVDPRHATLHDEDVHFAGTMRFEAELDLADALDLDRELSHHAAQQKALGSTESLDVRRSKALGDLARTQTALDLMTGDARIRAGWTPMTGFPLHARSSSTPTSTPARSARPLCSVPPADSTRASGSCCSTSSRPGAATAGRRSPSSPSSTSTPPCPRPATRSPTGSANRSSSATAPACSRDARDRPAAATSTTSSSTTTTRRPKGDHNPAPQAPATSPACAGSTTASRPTVTVLLGIHCGSPAGPEQCSLVSAS